MLTITLDASDVIRTLSSMEELLKNFPSAMGQELTDWQTEDMHRRYPNTAVSDNAAETEIWPTSRVVERDPRRIRAALTATRRTVRVKASGAPRPILRPELYERLVERMSELMSERLSWR